MPWLRRVQKQLLTINEAAVQTVHNALDVGKEKFQILDESAGISARTKAAGNKIRGAAHAIETQFAISNNASLMQELAKDLTGKAVDAGRALADRTGATEKVTEAQVLVQENLLKPARDVFKRAGVAQVTGELLIKAERGYGATREKIKPYFAAEDAGELLRNTRQELAAISACIMQIKLTEAEQLAGQFGNSVVAKISGVATIGALLSLVSALGTAGTGTAISALSGAAATNATIAWVGGLLGGGMATGAVLTGGIGLVVGLGAYKLLGSERRAFESLSDLEQRLVQSCWLYVAIIDEHLAHPVQQFSGDTAKALLENAFRPLLHELQANQDEICLQLDIKNAVAFRQHVLVDFQRTVIEEFERFNAEGVPSGLSVAECIIGGVFYALLTQSAVDENVESQLVLDALRRYKNDLSNATEAELGDYLRSLPADSLKPVGESVKGIYHELLYVHDYNAAHTETYAEVFGATNHPGADIQIKDADTHQVLEEIQLKAVSDSANVTTHIERYPDIPVQVTNEVAAQMADPTIASSGYDNEVLRAKVHGDFAAVADNSMFDRAGDAALLAAGVASAQELVEMLRGERAFPQAAINVLQLAGVAGAATTLTTLLFG